MELFLFHTLLINLRARPDGNRVTVDAVERGLSLRVFSHVAAAINPIIELGLNFIQLLE